MREILVFIYAFIICINLNAQQADLKNYGESKVVKGLYIGASSGINNPAGLLGIRINSGITYNTMLDVGLGIGSWGYKLSAGTILKSNKPKGFVPVFGFSYASGIENLKMDSAQLINQNQPNKPVVDTTLNARLMPAFAANIGTQWQYYTKKGNRIAIDLGYSLLLAGGSIKVKDDGYTMTEFTERVIKILRPGGIMIGFSYMWAR